MILSIAFFSNTGDKFFHYFKKKSSKKREKGLQLDSNSRSGCYKADALTIGPQSFYRTRAIITRSWLETALE